MIELSDIQLSYGKNVVIPQMTFTWQTGKIHGIAGLNGAGKTTLFHALSGMKKPLTGHMRLGHEPLHKSMVFLLETSTYFYPNITGREYLSLFVTTRENYDEVPLLELFQIPLDELIENYSTGMKKKLAILAMLRKNKNIYLLDEPFNGLDLESNHILEVMLKVLKERGSTLFIASHILDPLLRICDEIHLLEKGVFTRHFDKAQFEEVSPALFGNLAEKARTVIENVL
jgi:ABC-2 type transport system ATP-binding protein